MKIALLIIFMLSVDAAGFAQKRPLDAAAYDCWQSIGTRIISTTGDYVIFSIKTGIRENLVIASTRTAWKQKIENVSTANIVGNQYALFKIGKDSIGIIELGKGLKAKIGNAQSFTPPPSDTSSWIVYESKNPERRGQKPPSLTVLNLNTLKEQKLAEVDEYMIAPNAKALILKRIDSRKQSTLLTWLNLETYKEDTVFNEKATLSNIIFDKASSQLLFLVHDAASTNEEELQIAYFKMGMPHAINKINCRTPGMEKGWQIGSGELKFSENGERIYFSVTPKAPAQRKDNAVTVQVWNYQDSRLRSVQLSDSLSGKLKKNYTATLNEYNQVIRLEGKDESLILGEEGDADQALVISSAAHKKEADWLGYPRKTAYLVSLMTGQRKEVSGAIRTLTSFVLSPGAKYVVWYDPAVNGYYSYNVNTGGRCLITRAIPVPLYYTDYDKPGKAPPFGIAGWSSNDEAIFIYDEFDIWEVALNCKNKPVNITGGYGRRSVTVFRYYGGSHLNVPTLGNAVISSSESMLLTAFNKHTRYSGFFETQLHMGSSLHELTMGPYEYPYIEKSKNGNGYLVGRMSNKEPEDLFITSDCRKFNRLSNLNPQQKEYIGMTAALVKWKMLDGRLTEGILYKPEDFDPKKKYPVIIHFYEKDEYGLYQYLAPEPSNGTMNIPYFVSNGYMVFVPNIYYNVGHPGESAYNSIVSAARFLAQKSFVDATKMGIHGHSFGGYEVNYLVVHSHLFAAAESSAGISNFLSGYGFVRTSRDVQNTFWMDEIGQTRLGGTLWSNRQAYIENSPIFYADKATTPLLLMHNEKDAQVPFEQGVEFFNALRRLGKKAWLLQYEGEGHAIRARANELDFSIRLMQFFDHYLKGSPAPEWLTKEISTTVQ